MILVWLKEREDVQSKLAKGYREWAIKYCVCEDGRRGLVENEEKALELIMALQRESLQISGRILVKYAQHGLIFFIRAIDFPGEVESGKNTLIERLQKFPQIKSSEKIERYLYYYNE